jgi:hypothetical protein
MWPPPAAARGSDRQQQHQHPRRDRESHDRATGTCLASNISALFPARAITVFGFPVLKESRISNYICQLIYTKTSSLDTSSPTIALTGLNFLEQTIAT